MAELWCKISVNLDSHPRIRKAGRLGREVFLFALRRNADPANPVPGMLPEMVLEPWFIADQLMMSEEEAVTGVTGAVTAGLLTRDGRAWIICGWNDEWGRQPTSGADRTAKWRQALKNKRPDNPSVTDVTRPTSLNVTRDGGDALDKNRIEKNTKTPIVPKGDVSSLRPTGRTRKPKPTEPTPVELASVRVVLDKLTAQNGVSYSGSKEHTRLIVARLRDGASEMDLRYVIGYCALELGWKDKPDMLPYLRPETLFGPKTVERYLDPARTWAADADPKPAPLPKPTTFGPELDEPDWIAGGAHG